MHIAAKLDTLLSKAKKLNAENRRLGDENARLLEEIAALKIQLKDRAVEMTELNNQIKIIKLAQNLGNGNAESFEIKELKQKLNEYIKEIDNCMAMLNE